MKSYPLAKLPTHTQYEFVSKDVLSKIHGRTADALSIKKCLYTWCGTVVLKETSKKRQRNVNSRGECQKKFCFDQNI